MNFDGVVIFYPSVDDGSILHHPVLQSAVGVGDVIGSCAEMVCCIQGAVLSSGFPFQSVDDAASDTTPAKYSSGSGAIP